MSWMKKRGTGAANTNTAVAPPVPMFNPNQHSNQENQWQQDNNTSSNWYSQPGYNQQNYFQPGYNPPVSQQGYQQPNQYQQQQHNPYQAPPQQDLHQNQGYYQNAEYQHQNYSNTQYNQPAQQQHYGYTEPHNNTYGQTQPTTDGDSWNWGWGDEDNSNMQAPQQQQSEPNKAAQNNITESFAKDESWNWALEENQKSESKTVPEPRVVEEAVEHVFPKMGKLAEKHRASQSEAANPPKLEPIDSYEPIQQPVVENLPGALTGKRNKMDHLTPQWSIESQMSQDSSDDIVHTSESDKSRIISRSSTISQSPISGHDTNLESLNPAHVAETAIAQELSPREENIYYEQNHVHLENVEIPFVATKDPALNLKKNPTPPLPLKNLTPPLMPPMGMASTEDNKNPYKRTGILSHKTANRATRTQEPVNNYFAPQSNFAPPFNQSVNLETLPDNSEHPDTVPQHPPRKTSQSKPMLYLENNEIAPINERNQYLETGQLSDESTNNLQGDKLPPPGLDRMVLGQMEHGDLDLNPPLGSDEPPPGLCRMVLGQTESSSSLGNNQIDDSRQYDSTGPPAWLHRMVPGESSSPESTNRHQYSSKNYQDHNPESREEDYISESELNQLASCITPQPRSATIGADTPPTVTNLNRSETMGANHEVRLSNSSSVENRIGAIGLDTNARDLNLTGASNSDQIKNEIRRESIEGQPQDNEMANLVSSVRDLTVGENPTDGQMSANSNHDPPRRHSRQESTDSDHDDRGKSPKDRRDRRYKDKEERRERDKGRSRYSPDSYKEKRYDKRRFRDKRYDEDTDYLSDKERRNAERGDRREDYDKKYSSLRRDKDREKKRRDPREQREYGRDGRRDRDYYYHRYEDGYDEESRSRPTSRSDSMHDSYRERGHERDHRRNRDRDRDHHRRHRGDPYNSYMQGYGYGDPYNQYYQQYQYQYYENLRRTNPQAYAEWYRKYYQQAGQPAAGFGTEDRASVHSGRSSVNDELSKDRYTRQSYYSQASLPHMSAYYREPNSISSHYGMDESRPFDHTDSSLNFEDTTIASQRMTPAKFATAHIKCSIASGKFIKILPHYPLDGQPATVQIASVQAMIQNDDEYKDLVEFPGPLVKGVTHKKTIIEYCENKIRSALSNSEITDPESYILMWELLILLLRQNGVVVGTDIAELLMKGKRSNKRTQSESSTGSVEVLEEPPEVSPSSEVRNSSPTLKEEVVTNKFREYLIYGSEKEALEWAMKHGLWGHALFLASKLDKRTYANVMTRFANGLTMNDPLQTLYQLLSGRIPASVTCVADEKWGDWRPHLAMILSNTSQRPDLDLKAITTLGDTLMSRGSLYAAQFCYIMAQVNFSRYGADGAKLVLLGSNHSKLFTQFATNEAIHMTEVYEYARTLNEGSFILPEFQAYKFLIASRLADRGLLEKSLSYLERVSLSIIQNPSSAQPTLINRICILADRLKFVDPVVDPDDHNIVGTSDFNRPDNSWLKDLKSIQNDFNLGLISHESVNNLLEPSPEYDSLQQQQQQYYDQQYQQQSWQNTPQVETTQNEYQAQDGAVLDSYNSGQYQDQQQSFWDPNSQQYGETLNQAVHQYTQEESQGEQLQSHNDYWNNTQTEQGDVEKEKPEETTRPQITMPNQPKGKSPFDEPEDDLENEKPSGNSTKKASPAKQQQNIPKQDKGGNTGWFGGIWNRLALRPKNQMKLPDDKNPTIVWDPEKKRWVNTEEDNNDSNNELKPPPKMSDLMGNKQNIQPAMSPPSAEQQQQQLPPQNVHQNAYSGIGGTQNVAPVPSGLPMNNGNSHNVTQDAGKPPIGPNMFKLQSRSRSLKNSYVDVFNPGGKPTVSTSTLPAPDTFGMAQPPQQHMNFFVPQPITDPNAPINFLTPAPQGNLDTSQINNQVQ